MGSWEKFSIVGNKGFNYLCCDLGDSCLGRNYHHQNFSLHCNDSGYFLTDSRKLDEDRRHEKIEKHQNQQNINLCKIVFNLLINIIRFDRISRVYIISNNNLSHLLNLVNFGV